VKTLCTITRSLALSATWTVLAFGQAAAPPAAAEAAPPSETATPPVPAPAAEPAPIPAAPAPAEAPAEVGLGLPAPSLVPMPESDHATVVGHLAVGYLGFTRIPLGVIPPNSLSGATAGAPIIGVRYWLNRRMGIDAGLGFAWVSGSNTTELEDADDVEADAGTPSALLLHGGLPLSLAAASHYSFQIVPEFNLGFSGREGEDAAGATIEQSGFLLSVGARAGAEIHFGFMDLPQLSLQGSIGAFFDYVSGTTETRGEGIPTVTERSHRVVLSTTLHESPWNIFVTNLAALYYF
jgi:hypothetical protein